MHSAIVYMMSYLAVGFPLTWSALAQAADNNIIVTAEKRPLELKQTSTSVTVITQEDIQSLGLRGVQDIYGRLANLSPTYGSSGFSIRGVSNVGVSGAGEAATATVFIDNVPMASTYLHAAPSQLWDVARIEILRGPQSTLQGLNTLAGAIFVQTTDPSLDTVKLRARAAVTNEWLLQEAIAISTPIVPGQLAIRISAERLDRDGFIRNVVRNSPEDAEERTTVRAKLFWSPNTLPAFSVKFGYTRYRRKGAFYTIYSRTDTPEYLDHRISTDNTPNTTYLTFDGANMELRHKLSKSIEIFSVTSWNSATEKSQYDGDFGPLESSFGKQLRRYRTATQELRINFEGPSLSGLIGFFYYDRKLASATTSRTDVQTPISTIADLLQANGFTVAQANGIATLYGQILPTVRVNFNGNFPTRVRTAAIFADGRYHVTRQLSVITGFRFDHEVHNTRNLQQSSFEGTYPNPENYGSLAPVFTQINNGVSSLISQSNSNLPLVTRRFNSILPKAGLLMEWNSALTTGFVVQRGYRSGGSSTNIARGLSFPYDAEYTWNYELSLRSSLLQQSLVLNANAFYTDWKRQQVSVNFGLNSFDINTVNAGKSHIYGFEVQSDYTLLQNLKIHGAAGFVRTKFDQFESPLLGVTPNLSGSEFAFAPRWTLSGYADYRHISGWGGLVAVRYSSNAFGTIGPKQSHYPVESHLIFDAKLGYDSRHWSIQMIINNITDKKYIMYISPIERRAILNNTRTIGLSVEAKF